MAQALPTYPPFDPDEEISSLPQKWEDWTSGLDDLLAACAITGHERKFSVLKFYGGEKLRKLEKQLTYDRTVRFGANPNANPAVVGEPDHYRALKEALTAHFAPCVNETYARFKFRSISQDEGVSTDTFYHAPALTGESLRFSRGRQRQPDSGPIRFRMYVKEDPPKSFGGKSFVGPPNSSGQG